MTDGQAPFRPRAWAATTMVARWFHTNVGQIEGFTIEAITHPDGTRYRARATLSTVLTPEEHAAYLAAIAPATETGTITTTTEPPAPAL